jgi:hypothetical protein
MRMQTSPGQRIQTITGHLYTADAQGFIDNVDGDDVSELARVGCRVVAQPPEEPEPPLAAAEPLEVSGHLPQHDGGVFDLEPAAIGHHEAPERSE